MRLSGLRAWLPALALSTACLGAAPAHAVAARDCFSLGTWSFSQPLTTASGSGSVQLDAQTTCLRYTAGGGFTTESYTSFFVLGYTGNCAAMVLTSGATVVGAMAAEQVITTHGVGSLLSSAVHVVTAHPVCAGATKLTSAFHWVHLMP